MDLSNEVGGAEDLECGQGRRVSQEERRRMNATWHNGFVAGGNSESMESDPNGTYLTILYL